MSLAGFVLLRGVLRRVSARALLAGFHWAVSTAALAANPSAGGSDRIVRQADDSQQVGFVLTLPLRNPAGLRALLQQLYDPRSANFRHFLSAVKFDARYGPSAEAYASLKAFAVDAGLAVTGEHGGRSYIDVTGTAAQIRGLFKTQMNWRQSQDGRQYLASDAEPSPPSALSSIGGNAAALMQKPLAPLVRFAGRGVTQNAGSGPSGTFEPADIKRAYNLNAIQNGGRPVALIELSSANYADAQTYAAEFNLNNPLLTQIAVDGGTTAETGNGPLEVLLDIEMVMLVSNTAGIYVYTAPNTTAALLDTYAQIADDNLVGQVSTSWGLSEADVGSATANAENTQFEKMAALGIAVFAATGDAGAYACTTLCVQDPSSQPYVTGVGGTVLTTSAGQAYASESAWTDGGGGISALWSIPSYQSGVAANDTQFSHTMRNVPDVALAAGNPGYYIYCSKAGGWVAVDGTSAAAPQWAAFWGLIGQGLRNRAGFANPTLYGIAKNIAAYASAFHDVTTGNNGYYDTFAVYDNATGLGSYNGGGLYAAVTGARNTASMVPIINLLLSH
jgi:kumamolisin